MSLKERVMKALKDAMKNKDSLSLESLRAIKSELLLMETSGKGAITEADEIKILQRMVKQRKESAATYLSQNRNDLAKPELAQAEVISQFLPDQMSKEDIQKIVIEVAGELGASSMVDMGKVMGVVTKRIAGKADGKTISELVKAHLSS